MHLWQIEWVTALIRSWVLATFVSAFAPPRFFLWAHFPSSGHGTRWLTGSHGNLSDSTFIALHFQFQGQKAKTICRNWRARFKEKENKNRKWNLDSGLLQIKCVSFWEINKNSNIDIVSISVILWLLLTAITVYLNQAFLTIRTGGRAGEFPVGETNRSQTATDVVMVIK